MKFELNPEEWPEAMFYKEHDIKGIARRFSEVIRSENKRFDRKLQILEVQFKAMVRNLEDAFIERHIARTNDPIPSLVAAAKEYKAVRKILSKHKKRRNSVAGLV